MSSLCSGCSSSFLGFTICCILDDRKGGVRERQGGEQGAAGVCSSGLDSDMRL